MISAEVLLNSYQNNFPFGATLLPNLLKYFLLRIGRTIAKWAFPHILANCDVFKFNIKNCICYFKMSFYNFSDLVCCILEIFRGNQVESGSGKDFAAFLHVGSLHADDNRDVDSGLFCSLHHSFGQNVAA